MSGITTHILDTSRGRPASGVEVRLLHGNGDGWREVGRGLTDGDGRITSFAAAQGLETGTYALRFEIGDYFESLGVASFYPYAEIVFRVKDPRQHYHVPLLLNPFGYSTYRGS